MRHVILYRRCNSLAEDEREIQAIRDAGFTLLFNRTQVQKGDLILPRYSCLPFYKELEEDIRCVGAKLLNTYQQHRYIADLQNWVSDLQELTPETWDNIPDLPEQGAFVLKGETNSKKGNWKTHMFAPDKQTAKEIFFRLQDDGLIGQQKIFIRKFVPLYTYMHDAVGMPVTKEFRFFICDGKVLSSGFYWSSHIDDIPSIPSVDEVPTEFLQEVINRIDHQARSYVVDVWITQEGKPIVGELNEFAMSGLSENDPNILYPALKKHLEMI